MSRDNVPDVRLQESSACIKMSVKGIFVVMTFSVMTWKSLGLKWTTETLHASCCEGEDKILLWNCSLEKNETVQDSQWFFQSTQIAYVSESVKFDVHDLYKGRLEQFGKLGILLKNVSSVDAGNYSLYLNLGPDPPENMQTIFLKVFEAPTYQCKPSIISVTNYSGNFLSCLTNSCGGIHSTEWRISEKYDFASNDSYLKINSLWNAERVSCCLHRQNMQCQNSNFLDVCASTFIFIADKHAPDSKCTENCMNLTTAVIVLAMTIFLSIVICLIYRIKICRISGRRHMDEILELVCLKGHETRSTMGGTSPETSAINLMTGARSSLSEGAMQDKDAKLKLEANMEPYVFLLMGGRPSDAET